MFLKPFHLLSSVSLYFMFFFGNWLQCQSLTGAKWINKRHEGNTFKIGEWYSSFIYYPLTDQNPVCRKLMVHLQNDVLAIRPIGDTNSKKHPQSMWFFVFHNAIW